MNFRALTNSGVACVYVVSVTSSARAASAPIPSPSIGGNCIWPSTNPCSCCSRHTSHRARTMRSRSRMAAKSSPKRRIGSPRLRRASRTSAGRVGTSTVEARFLASRSSRRFAVGGLGGQRVLREGEVLDVLGRVGHGGAVMEQIAAAGGGAEQTKRKAGVGRRSRWAPESAQPIGGGGGTRSGEGGPIPEVAGGVGSIVRWIGEKFASAGCTMTSLSAQKNERTYTMGRKADTQWSDIDKTRLYSIGTVMYSALTVALHPLTVAKIRRQVLQNNGKSSAAAPSTSSGSMWSNIGQYYRGLGIVVSLAIPARIIYISTLEYSRETVDAYARRMISHPPSALAAYDKELKGLMPLVTPIAGGVAGGLAAVSSQLIVVPMDVISQKLMVMEDSVYKKEGSSMKVARSIVKANGFRGLYKGFGLSLFTSLPAGSIWWATYAGCKDQLSVYADRENDALQSIPVAARQGLIQVSSAFSAAISASVMTQPLDTIKTRIQVGSTGSRSLLSLAKELPRGLYKGLYPRIAHMEVWGSVLSSAYEVLKLVSRKDFELEMEIPGKQG
ncbi:hypothetical protein ACHAXT_008043 [Thalassiosira profunda]